MVNNFKVILYKEMRKKTYLSNCNDIPYRNIQYSKSIFSFEQYTNHGVIFHLRLKQSDIKKVKKGKV